MSNVQSIQGREVDVQSGQVKLHGGILKDDKRRKGQRKKVFLGRMKSICKLRATWLSEGNYKSFSTVGTGLATFRSCVSEQTT